MTKNQILNIYNLYYKLYVLINLFCQFANITIIASEYNTSYFKFVAILFIKLTTNIQQNLFHVNLTGIIIQLNRNNFQNFNYNIYNLNIYIVTIFI